MNKTLFSIFLTLLLISTLYLPNTFAQYFPYTTLTEHRGNVYSVAFSPDGKTLASGSADNTIRLWNAATGDPLKTLTEHRGTVYSVAFSPDGKTLASGSYDDTIRLWNAATGDPLKTLTEHRDTVLSVAFSPDGKTLASGSADNTIRLWNAATGDPLKTLTEHRRDVTSVAFSPDGKTLASGNYDDTIRLWNAATGDPLKTLTEHRDTVLSVAFSPDGKTLASGSADNTIRLWNAATGDPLKTLTEHKRDVTSVAFSPDGKTLASGNYDDTIRLWNAATGDLLQTLTEHRGTVYSVAFSPDGKTLASGSADNTIRLWSIPTIHVSITPNPVVSPVIGEEFSITVHITQGETVGGYQLTLGFNPTALRYVSSANGEYLTKGSYFVKPVVSENEVTLGATNFANVSNGDGSLATITFEVVDVKESALNLSRVILTDSDSDYLGHYVHDSKIVEPSPVPSSAVISITPSSVLSPARRQLLSFNIDIAGGQNVADYKLIVQRSDATALEYISRSPGDYLDGGVGNGDGTLATVTFKIRAAKASTISVYGHLIGTDGLRYIPTFESASVVEPLLGDVNRDGVVNISDLVLVASSFSQEVPEEGNPADVNEDNIVNIVDLVKVAGVIGGEAAAPSAWNRDLEGAPTRAEVQQWLSQAQQLDLTDPISQRGIRFLEQLLAALTPKETALLSNYPNPFNPETWIPYHLAHDADVTLTIYNTKGAVVRRFKLGHQPAGFYTARAQAAYWNGRNANGESVASGIYFYQLRAGDYSALRRMVIVK